MIFVLAESHGSTEEVVFVTEESQRLPEEAVSLFMSSKDLFTRRFCLLMASKDLFDASGSHRPCKSGGQLLAIVNLGRPAGSSAWAEATYSRPGDCTRLDRVRSRTLLSERKLQSGSDQDQLVSFVPG